VDVYPAIASKRDVRAYAATPIPEDVRHRILDAGRLAGSARNRQLWRFHVVEDVTARERLAEAVYAPGNLRDATLIVAITTGGKGSGGFDCGRAAQNMMLAAWDEGIVSCPNGIADQDGARVALSLGEEDQLHIVLSLGYPARPRDPLSRTAEQWSQAANRKPLDEVVRRV
jgi:nitroreductase